MAVSLDTYVWKTPRDGDADEAAALVRAWHESYGADPARWPSEPNDDVGWFHRELLGSMPSLDVVSDGVPPRGPVRTWLPPREGEEPMARVVALSLRRSPTDPSRDVTELVYSLAAKYDLVVFDVRAGRVHVPLEEMADVASATFWPRGAIRAAAAGLAGAAIAVGAWLAGVPIVSGVVVIVGGFLAVMAVYTFVHEGRKALQARRS